MKRHILLCAGVGVLLSLIISQLFAEPPDSTCIRTFTERIWEQWASNQENSGGGMYQPQNAGADTSALVSISLPHLKGPLHPGMNKGEIRALLPDSCLPMQGWWSGDSTETYPLGKRFQITLQYSQLVAIMLYSADTGQAAREADAWFQSCLSQLPASAQHEETEDRQKYSIDLKKKWTTSDALYERRESGSPNSRLSRSYKIYFPQIQARPEQASALLIETESGEAQAPPGEGSIHLPGSKGPLFKGMSWEAIRAALPSLSKQERGEIVDDSTRTYDMHIVSDKWECWPLFTLTNGKLVKFSWGSFGDVAGIMDRWFWDQIGRLPNPKSVHTNTRKEDKDWSYETDVWRTSRVKWMKENDFNKVTGDSPCSYTVEFLE